MTNSFWQLYGEAVMTAFGFFWKAGWAFVFGILCQQYDSGGRFAQSGYPLILFRSTLFQPPAVNDRYTSYIL